MKRKWHLSNFKTLIECIQCSNNETNFPYKLLLNNIQVSRLCKTLANGLSANIEFSKTQLPKMTQLGAFLFKKLAATSQAMFLTRVEVLTPELAIGATRYYVNKGIN